MAARSVGARYPIRTAARLSGLSPDTLRVWERRYRAVEPTRSNGGARYYSESELSRLTLLRRAVDAGHAIRHVATLGDAELRKLVGAGSRSAAAQAAASPLDAARQRFLTALERFDLPAAELELERVAAFARPLELCTGLLVPLMIEIGERCQEGTLGIAQEHAASAAVRTLLGSLIHTYNRQATGPTLLAATLDGELHELGVLLAALVAASHRFRVAYLGPSVPADDLVAVARATRPRALAVSLAWPEGNELILETIAYLRQKLPQDLELWVGGAGTERLGARLPLRTRRLGSLEELDRFLGEL